MDTVTYPNESVQAYLNEHFVLAKFNTAQPDAVKEVTRQFRAQWTPTFVFLDHHGIEVRRTVGYLPPAEFLPELERTEWNLDPLVDGRGEEGVDEQACAQRVLAALVEVENLAELQPGPGAMAFGAVVVLTMLATPSFDPRMLFAKPEGEVVPMPQQLPDPAGEAH